MYRWLPRLLLALVITAAGLPLARETEAAGVTLNYDFNAQAKVGNVYFGTAINGQSPVDVTSTPAQLSWNAKSQTVSFTATLVFSIDSTSPVSVRLIGFRWRTSDGSASGSVPINGTVTTNTSENHKDYRFSSTVGGIDYVFSGSISVVGPNATAAAGNVRFGTGMTDAGNPINEGTSFPSNASVLWVRFDVYNVISQNTVVTWQWYKDGTALFPDVNEEKMPLSGNTWLFNYVCAATDNGCDPSQSLPAGTYENRVWVNGVEAVRGSATIQSSSSPQMDAAEEFAHSGAGRLDR